MKLLEAIIPQRDREVRDTRSWKKVGRSLGSNPGGVHEDESGERWYVKHSHTDDHAHNEILASRMYERLGVPTLEPELIRHSKGLGVASRMKDIQEYNPHDHNDIQQVAKHMGAHMFLSNHDYTGLVNDNQAHTDKGMTTLDAGGALNYRAQGAPKGSRFGDKVDEWDNYKNHNLNHNSAHIMDRIKADTLIKSIKPIAGLKNSEIHSLVHTHGPGSYDDKVALTNKMISRKQDLLHKANSLAKIHNLKPLQDVD